MALPTGMPGLASRWALLVVVVCLCGVALCADYYVSSTSGSNDNDGSSSSPFLTINAALQSGASGDTIYCYPGIYAGDGNVGLTINYSVSIALAPGSEPFSANISGGSGNSVTAFTVTTGDLTVVDMAISEMNTGFAVGALPMPSSPLPTLTLDNCLITESSYGVYQASLYYSSVTISNSHFQQCSYSVYSDISSNSCLLTVTNTTFTAAPFHTADSSGETLLTNCTIQQGDGNAVYVHSAPTVFVDSVFLLNSHSGSSGAAAYVRDTTLLVQGCTFEANSADYGGALTANAADLQVEDCTFKHNVAKSSGGGVYLYAGSSFLASNCTFDANYALVGGACSTDGTVAIQYSDITLINNKSNVTGDCFSY